MRQPKCPRYVRAVMASAMYTIQEGERRQYVRVYFDNGEHHYVLRDEGGNASSSPSVFWSEPKRASRRRGDD